MEDFLIVISAVLVFYGAVMATLLVIIKSDDDNLDSSIDQDLPKYEIPCCEKLEQDDDMVLPDLHKDESISDEQVLLDVMLSCAEDLNYEVMPDGDNAEVVVMVKKDS